MLLVFYGRKHGLSSLHALQILPQWPQLDLSPSGAVRPSAALPAPASLPSTALPQPRAIGSAAKQPAEPRLSSAHLPESMQPAGLPGSITMAAAHAAEPLLDDSDVGVSTSARDGGKDPCDAPDVAVEPIPDPNNADLTDGARLAGDTEAKQAGGGMANAGSQSRLAASVSASILGGNSTAAAPDKQQGAPAHAEAEQGMHSRPADASAAPMDIDLGAVQADGAPGAMLADDDISKPVGQAEASKLIGVRDDLDQLGPAQPDVPCCSSAGAHDDETLEGHCTEQQQQQRTYTGLSTASAQHFSEMPAWQPDRSHSATAVHGALNDNNTEGGLLHGLPPPEMLPQLGVREYPRCSAMQQASAPGLFDPTAITGQGQSPAANGFESHSSPTCTDAAGKTSLSSLWQQRMSAALKLKAIMHSDLHPLSTWSISR